MPPKKGVKLTKKQIEEQKKEAARLQREKEEEEAEAERARLSEEQRLAQIEQKKMMEEERVRIVGERESKYPEIEARIKNEKLAFEKLQAELKWKHFTSPYSKDYSIEGTNLSTFTSIFRSAEYKNPKETLSLCDQCQIYIGKLEEKILESRADYDQQKEEEYRSSIITLQNEVIKKLQAIMIQYANSGQQMEERNVEEAKKKNEQNAVQKAIKPVDSVFEMTPNYKIGMYINTPSTKNYNKFSPLSIKQFGFNTEVPPKWQNNTSIVKFEWLNFNSYAPEKQEEFRVVGGVFNLEFYDMFVGTKKISNICIKKFYKGREILEKFKLPSSAIKESFRVMYEIPSYVFLAPYNKSNIKIAQFDVANSKWNIVPNDSIVQYLEADKRVICKVSKPQPIAFVENKCADYPYVAWELRTVQKGKILLDIQLKRSVPTGKEQNASRVPLMLQFEIGPNVVKLKMDQDYKEFADLCSDYLTPETMLSELSKRGIHLLPDEHDYQYAGLKPKDRESEKNAIRDVAYAVESFTIRSQPNATNNILVKIRENLDYEYVFLEDQEKDWKQICWADGGKCSVTNRGIKLRHMNLEILLETHDICEKECHERMKFDQNFLLRRTMMKFLELTRLLAFTTAEEETSTTLLNKLKTQLVVE